MSFIENWTNISYLLLMNFFLIIQALFSGIMEIIIISKKVMIN